jgi:hypothetical protein
LASFAHADYLVPVAYRSSLLSILRLGQALARLHFRDVVTKDDVEEVSHRSATHCAPFQLQAAALTNVCVFHFLRATGHAADVRVQKHGDRRRRQEESVRSVSPSVAVLLFLQFIRHQRC